MNASEIPELREKFCKRSFNHRPHTWIDDSGVLGSVDFTCPGLWGPAWSSTGKRSAISAPNPTSTYVEAEGAMSREKAMDRLLTGSPAGALFLMLRTVEAQLRIEGIGGVVLPYRPKAVAR